MIITVDKTPTNQFQELTLADINYISSNTSKNLSDINLIKHQIKDDHSFEELKVSLKDFAGKSVIVHFWATWCQPCIRELPQYDRFVQSQKDIINIAVVSDGTSAKLIQEFYNKHNLKNLVIFTDPQGTLARTLQITGLPTTVFINKKGEEAGRVMGLVEWENNNVINLLLKQIA